VEEGALADRFWALSTRVRKSVRSGFVTDGAAAEGDSSVVRALFEALVLGDAGGLPSDWGPALRRTGTVHVLAVSGLHVGLLLLVVLRLGGGASPAVRALVGWVALCAYLVLVGPRPSLVRAAVMGGGGLLSLLAERPRTVGAALEWALLLLVVSNPVIVRDFGFQLTASATFSILWASKKLATLEPLSARARSIWAPCVGRIGTGIAAQLGTLPFLLPRVGLTAVWGPFANLVAIPWAALALSASWIWLLLGLEQNRVGRLWGSVLRACAWGPSALAELPSSRLAAQIGFPIALFCLVLAASLGALSWRELCRGKVNLLGQRRQTVRGWLALLLAALVLLFAFWRSGRSIDAHPEMIFLDVGQGDATLIRDGDEAVLIDGGGWLYGDIASSVLVPALAGLDISQAPSIAVTHADRDHCKGLLELSAVVPIDAVWVASGWRAGECTRRLGALPGVQTRLLWRGHRMRVGRWSLEVLWPPPGTERSENQTSLVLLAEVHGRRVLLPGDIGSSIEQEILEGAGWRDDPRVDLLKLAHHGSKTSTSEAWLDATRPRLSIASVGRDNPYRHPAEVVLGRLDQRNLRVLRTDLVGAIRVGFPEERALQVITAVPASEFD